ncbi:amidohydrolase [Kutzneria sp. CA-103260]|uniref:amidohydrolase n=1 Tax=Kutzneria sp. CA-103260 TaxID=2802641 RepID=UPI001BAD1F48|nr:amidohydrolase [Kutzneria sp. CA-103260]QUQ66595.1 amidohydrolase [Kutzneria sp. CA-103260]
MILLRTAKQSVAIAGNRIVAVGPEAEALDAAEVMELAGTLSPAFGDGHAHPVLGGLERQGPAITDKSTVDDVVVEIGRWAAENPGDGWIVAASYDPALAPDGAFDARWLDAAAPDRPVALRSRDYHAVWCNSVALRRAGISADTPDPRLGRILRRPDGSPLGTLLEWHACDLVLDLVPQRSTEDLVEALAEAGRVYASVGVTWVQDAWVEPALVDAYLLAVEQDRLLFRADLAQRADPDRWRGQISAFADNRERCRRYGRDLVTARTVKFFADGVVESGTASMLDPYLDVPHSHGMPVWSPAELAEAVTAFDAERFQIHVHAIGDAAVRAALDAVERAQGANPAWDRRPVIAHAQVVDPADRPRFAELGVIATVQPQWAQTDAVMTELTIPRLGPERAERQYPFATLARLGTRLAFGSDWPVSPADPLEGLRVATSREWLPGERLDVAQAIAAQTAGVAWQARAEHEWGELAVGRRADLVCLSGDPEHTPLGDITVTDTWMSGRRIYAALTLDPEVSRCSPSEE